MLPRSAARASSHRGHAPPTPSSRLRRVFRFTTTTARTDLRASTLSPARCWCLSRWLGSGRSCGPPAPSRGQARFVCLGARAGERPARRVQGQAPSSVGKARQLSHGVRLPGPSQASPGPPLSSARTPGRRSGPRARSVVRGRARLPPLLARRQPPRPRRRLWGRGWCAAPRALRTSLRPTVSARGLHLAGG